MSAPTPATRSGASSQAVGSFTGSTPAGEYALTLTYTRVATGLQITWSMVQTADAAEVLNPATGEYDHNPTSGVYSYTGSVIDTSPASSTYTYDELGFFLIGGAQTNSTIELDDINVSSNVPEPATLLLGAIGTAGLLLKRRRR